MRPHIGCVYIDSEHALAALCISTTLPNAIRSDAIAAHTYSNPPQQKSRSRYIMPSHSKASKQKQWKRSDKQNVSLNFVPIVFLVIPHPSARFPARESSGFGQPDPLSLGPCSTSGLLRRYETLRLPVPCSCACALPSGIPVESHRLSKESWVSAPV